MVNYVDRLILNFEVQIRSAIKAFDIIERRMQRLQVAFGKISNIRGFESQLRDIGVGIRKNGDYFDLLTRNVISATEATRRFDKLERTGTYFGKNTKDILAGSGVDFVDGIVRKIPYAEKLLAQVNREMQKTVNVADKLDKRMKKFDMNMLSLLFGGMMLQRIFGGALREMYNSFMKVANYQSNVNRGLMQVQASFEFLKFKACLNLH